MIREWFVYGTPVKGYVPDEPGVTTCMVTGYANKVVRGPFGDVHTAALFVSHERPMQSWQKVAIYSKLSNPRILKNKSNKSLASTSNT